MMFFLPQRELLLSPNSNCRRIISMASKQFLLHKSTLIPTTQAYNTTQIKLPFSSSSNSPNHWSMLLASSPKWFFPIYQRASGYCHATMTIPRPINGVDREALERQLLDGNQLMILRQKLEEIGFDGSDCMPGQYSGLICPDCRGGDSEEKSLSLYITEDGGAAMWNCYRAKCGWSGTKHVFAEVKSTHGRVSKSVKKKQRVREITVEDLGLEPLYNDELLAFFAKRMISEETLRRNDVMQKRTRDDKIAIAFTYRRNTVLVSCKYRDITKKFWQEANTEKIFYGLNDIKEATDVIIVEGEMDKLAMEEAGFRNCVSVPDGAPRKVSNKALPSKEEDSKYRYIWNSKEYTDKASRIVLATDSDRPGQALAEELARRLGRERCWRVKWPKKNDTDSYKDANEVLMFMGPDALRDVIQNAELYR